MKRSLHRASQALEFALVLPIFLALIAGIVDYGWFFSQQLGVTQAAREGARAGALAWEDQNPEALATTTAKKVLADWDLSDATVQTQLAVDPELGQLVEVTVSTPYEPLLHLVPVPATLEQTVIMRTEIQPPPSS